jgi:hypothetical protein
MTTTGVRFPARFDPDTWERDLARSTPAGRAAAEAAKAEITAKDLRGEKPDTPPAADQDTPKG